ncbi:hypothetical protein [Streptomyces sp. NPDC059256]|uniref:effector-associated domain 2-containing protein n=1 Tax=Streptomyces sp. NPDC059256 TaxID=3346794 RepID=UPI00367C586D
MTAQSARPRTPTGPPPISNLPGQGLPFVGRDAQIAELLGLVEKHGHVLLHDLDVTNQGMGKTQMAIAYCLRYTLRYDVAWWFSCRGAHDDDTLAQLIGEQYRQLRAACEITGDFRPRRRSDPAWLFVYDQVEFPDRIYEHFVPGAGHRLITSRAAGRTWGDNQLGLAGLTVHESTGLLLNQAQNLTAREAALLAEVVDGHPGQLLTLAEIARDTGFESARNALRDMRQRGGTDKRGNGLPRHQGPQDPFGTRFLPAPDPWNAHEMAAPSLGGAAFPVDPPRARTPDGQQGRRAARLDPQDKRTLIEALGRSPVGRSRDSWDVFVDSIRQATRLDLSAVNDGSNAKDRIISLVNFALGRPRPDVMAAIADAVEERGEGEDEIDTVRRLVDAAVRNWDAC